MLLEVDLEILVVDMEELHPITQYWLARQTDIWFGITGAALAWLAFLPPQRVVLDAFPPESHFCTEGWRTNPVSRGGARGSACGYCSR